MILDKFPEVQRLSPSEKLIFVSELWNDLEANPSEVPVSQEVFAEGWSTSGSIPMNSRRGKRSRSGFLVRADDQSHSSRRMETVTLKKDRRHIALLKQQAKALGRSQAAVVRDLIDQHLAGIKRMSAPKNSAVLFLVRATCPRAN